MYTLETRLYEVDGQFRVYAEYYTDHGPDDEPLMTAHLTRSRADYPDLSDHDLRLFLMRLVCQEIAENMRWLPF
jgi:hypothetical protein